MGNAHRLHVAPGAAEMRHRDVSHGGAHGGEGQVDWLERAREQAALAQLLRDGGEHLSHTQ